ncbi:hypothetical protein DRW07_13205 [Alteromonas sediminis]|uniref:Secreted protein n=1 Tax=Alteromonas sediminis TaxID=2259342 RepID=A0A3N5XYJ9_9ALTE|nr:hypothetical protein DRW07_13205 [Alteromonas sediminis]
MIAVALFGVSQSHAVTKPAPLVSIPTHNAFFDAIKQHCGKAFEGEVSVDNQGPSTFSREKLVMHVRMCNDTQLHIPFHVGDNASRTWIITKTGSGLSLKHDHRKSDGHYDPVTMYGGHTLDAGFDHIQSFPVDEYSRQLFAQKGLPQSLTNIWQMYIYPDTFSYRLIREGREFRVDFDLTSPIAPPPPPWGYGDD